MYRSETGIKSRVSTPSTIDSVDIVGINLPAPALFQTLPLAVAYLVMVFLCQKEN